MLGDRVVEEAQRWSAVGPVPLVLVLCGEQTTLQVAGPRNDLVLRLRVLLEPQSDDTTHRVEPDGKPRVLSTPGPQWADWSYEDWNGALVDYCFRDEGTGSGPVERLAATPEELARVVRGSPEDAEVMAKAFVSACVATMPAGTSFRSFCCDCRSFNPCSSNSWTAGSAEPPHFFALLWLTCLVAYGYPDAKGGFHARYKRTVGKEGHLECLALLWYHLWMWTLKRREAGADIRELELPPEDDFRTTIGHSYFLAFPHEHDRRQLARVLVDADLVGFEPPITPVVARLEAERARFSKYFREDLDNFFRDFVAGDRDPRDSAFWRAVRQEALEPSWAPGGGRSRRGTTTILGVFDPDDGFLPFLGCAVGWELPEGYSARPLDNSIGGYEFFVVADGEGTAGLLDTMFGSFGLLGPGPRALLNQGVLVFLEDQSNEYCLVSGHDLNGADVALVRDDLVEAFLDTFGGVGEPSCVSGWHEVDGCCVRQLDDLPVDLDGVVQLLRTMNPPSIRLVGGIKVSGGHLSFEGLMPRVRALGADQVCVRHADTEIACVRNEDGEWVLPISLLEHPHPIEAEIEACWEATEGMTLQPSTKAIRLLETAVDDGYKSLVGGSYFVEACCPGQETAAAGAPIPLTITTDAPERGFDLLECDPTCRFLGPGRGEMALVAREGFEWVAVGPKKKPDLLVFVGDPENPGSTVARRSPHPGDRRHWRMAFTKAKTAVVRTSEGEYHPVGSYPKVSVARRAHLRHDPPVDSPGVEETRLDTLQLGVPDRVKPEPHTAVVADALAALSCRRGGLRYQTVSDVFADLTGVNDHGLHFELIRAWAESGAFDLVRHQAYSATRIVARRPRFVCVRRGPAVEASLVGLSTRARRALVERLARRKGLALEELKPGCPFQPGVLRVRGEEGAIVDLSDAADLEQPEWLRWEGVETLPKRLHVAVGEQGLQSDEPPKGFTPTRWWQWETAEFKRTEPKGTRVRVEQRVHRESCSVYVVVVDETPRLWTYIRNWALLAACEAAGRAPFRVNRKGWVTTEGRSPVHLPLPLGRLCTLVGEGVPGPVLETVGEQVGGYCYPFGRRVTELVSRVIPGEWLIEE